MFIEVYSTELANSCMYSSCSSRCLISTIYLPRKHLFVEVVCYVVLEPTQIWQSFFRMELRCIVILWLYHHLILGSSTLCWIFGAISGPFLRTVAGTSRYHGTNSISITYHRTDYDYECERGYVQGDTDLYYYVSSLVHTIASAPVKMWDRG